jgi:hypothetical protein
MIIILLGTPSSPLISSNPCFLCISAYFAEQTTCWSVLVQITCDNTLLYSRTSEYPDCRLLPFFEKPFCNQNFAFQNYISLKQNRVKPIHTQFEINWRLRVHYMNYSVCFTHCSKMSEIGRTWTYYIAKSDSSTPMVHFKEKISFTDPN